MSNLDNLVTKIINDSKARSKQIIESAEAKAAEIISENVLAAEKEKERILNEAEAEAQKAAELIVLGKKLEIRDKNLNAKQELIDKVFASVSRKLNNMPKKDFWNFLCKKLSSMDLDGEEIILPAGYGAADVDKLNEYLVKNNKKGNLKLYGGKRNISGGFILVKEGVENNNTFESLVEYYRYELESGIIAKLF